MIRRRTIFPDAESVEQFYRRVGERWAGRTLHCERCDCRETLTAAEATRYFGEDWPTCCGETMVLEEEGADAQTTA